MSERRIEAAATAAAKAIEHVADDHSEGMSFLSTLPQRVVRVYIPAFQDEMVDSTIGSWLSSLMGALERIDLL